jgi:hypothetical protein
MIFKDERKSGGSHSTKGSTGPRMENPTSMGMKSGLLAQAATRKLDMSSLERDHDEESNTKHDDPRMACTTSIDQTWAAMLETVSSTLH